MIVAGINTPDIVMKRTHRKKFGDVITIAYNTDGYPVIELYSEASEEMTFYTSPKRLAKKLRRIADWLDTLLL